MANEEIYPLPKNIELAFESASVLVVELNEQNIDPNKLQKLLRKKGMYGSDDSIKAHVSSELYESLHKTIHDNKYPLPNPDQYKPGVLSMILSSMQAVKLGYSPEFGIDRHFIKKAIASNKTIIELESMERQLALFIEVPNPSAFLSFTLTGLNKMGTQFEKMLALWQSGDAKSLNETILVQPLQSNSELKPIFHSLFFARNKAMATKLELLMASSGTYFVVVGAGHLIGEHGIIELLKQNHYKINQQ